MNLAHFISHKWKNNSDFPLPIRIIGNGYKFCSLVIMHKKYNFSLDELEKSISPFGFQQIKFSKSNQIVFSRFVNKPFLCQRLYSGISKDGSLLDLGYIRLELVARNTKNIIFVVSHDTDTQVAIGESWQDRLKGSILTWVMYLSPSCPKCNGLMTLRLKKGTQSRFWGCIEYPDCDGTKPPQRLD